MYRLFDAHCHIYPESIAQKAVEGIDRFYDHLPFRPYDGTTGTLLRIGREAGISHFLVHSVATSPRQVSSINRFIASEVVLSEGMFIRISSASGPTLTRLCASMGSARRRAFRCWCIPGTTVSIIPIQTGS